MSSSNLSRWFAEEVQPHEPALRAYLQARFPTLGDYDDIVQESYVRLLKAQAAGQVRYAKALLFTTARNAALDFFRRRRVFPLEAVTDFKELSVLEEQPGVAEQVDQHYELEVLADAVRALPDRCRQVIMLRYLDNLSYKEIATQLGISPETVKVHMAKGMRRCVAFFVERGLMEANPSAARQTVEHESNRPVAGLASPEPGRRACPEPGRRAQAGAKIERPGSTTRLPVRLRGEAPKRIDSDDNHEWTQRDTNRIGVGGHVPVPAGRQRDLPTHLGRTKRLSNGASVRS